MSNYRSAALSWLPASLLFVGNIYAGSRALSRIVRHPNWMMWLTRIQLLMFHTLSICLDVTVFLSVQDIPFFFTLQNSSHVVSYIILKVVQREVSACTTCCTWLCAIHSVLHRLIRKQIQEVDLNNGYIHVSLSLQCIELCFALICSHLCSLQTEDTLAETDQVCSFFSTRAEMRCITNTRWCLTVICWYLCQKHTTLQSSY